MGMMQEFKAFAVKGNVVDLAVGVIIGAAFGKIVESLVQDIIMPVVGKIFGGLDFANYYWPLNGQSTQLTLVEAKKAGAVLAYGNFLTYFDQLSDPRLHHFSDGATDQQGPRSGDPAAGAGSAGR